MTMILPRLSRSTALAPPSHLLATTFLLLLALSHTVYGAPEKKAKPLDPCTVRSPTNHAFFDLNPIARHPPTEKDIERHKNDPEPYGAHSYHARGYDYGANFTLNFCAPVVEGVKDVEGVEERLWKNVTGYYEKGGRTYSIGTLNGEPFFRGRKLVLNYTEGSPCPGSSPSFLDRRSTTNRRGRRDLLSHEAEDLEKSEASKARPFWDDDGEDDDDDWRHRNNSSTSHDGVRRKSTILSLHCEKDPLAPKAHLSYVGSMDECTYFFEVRTLAACAGVETAKESVSPGGVFGVIAMIAILVYLVGGCVYQRHVMNQRGWRQLPNYGLWAGIGSAFKDCFDILTSSCARFLPSRRGYSRVAGNGYGRGRGSQSDQENRLIDSLDEEWDD